MNSCGSGLRRTGLEGEATPAEGLLCSERTNDGQATAGLRPFATIL
jgi:hypothetical protein